MKIKESVELLEEYAEYISDESSEVWQMLAQMHRNSGYISDEFVKALEKEIIDTAIYNKSHYKWVDRVVEVQEQKYKELVWIEDD